MNGVKLLTALFVVYVVWGSTYLAIAVADGTLPPFLMLSVRFALAGALLYWWARRRAAPLRHVHVGGSADAHGRARSGNRQRRQRGARHHGAERAVARRRRVPRRLRLARRLHRLRLAAPERPVVGRVDLCVREPGGR